MEYLRQITCVLFVLTLPVSLSAQDIEQIPKAHLLSSNGGISFSQIGNFSTVSPNSLIPYSYYLSGNLNNTSFGVLSIPMSFAYTNNKVTGYMTQPFNRFSMMPSYKWVTAHVGYSSMSFSPYTLSGHEFLGGGVELTPKESLKISAMYGRLRKSAELDTLGMEPSYRRMGGGLKVDYLHDAIDVGLNIFKATDDVNSVVFPNPDSLFIKPKDNLTGSVFLNLKLPANFSITAEYALSAMNNDISLDRNKNSSTNFIFDNDGDVAVHNAFKSSIAQSSDFGRVGATYERVSPNYNTLGTYYFYNDFENITANLSTSKLPWLNISADVGYQKDNLSKQKTNSSSRMIYSGNISSVLTKKLNVSASVSNMQSFVHIRDIYQEITRTDEFQYLDTLSFTQLNLTESVNLNYTFQSSDTRRQNFNAGFTFQEASEKQSDDMSFTGNKIYNSTLSYQFSLIPKQFNLSATVNHNHNRMPENTLNVVSYNLSLQKTFYKKIKAALIGTFSNTFQESGIGTNIFNIRATGGYLYMKRHNFNLSIAMVNKTGIRGTSTTHAVNLAYNYNFDFQLKREDKKFGFSGNF